MKFVLIFMLLITDCYAKESIMYDKLKKMLDAKERSNYVEKIPQDVYRQIEESTPLTKEEVAMIGGVESQHGKYEDNMAGSSAQGIMQVMPNLAKIIRPGSENSIKDRNIQAELASDIINYNNPTIKEIYNSNHQKPNILDHYAMYNLGRGRGKKYIEATDETPIEQVLPSKVIKANPKLYKYKTVGESKQKLRDFLAKRGQEIDFYPNEQDMSNLFKEEE